MRNTGVTCAENGDVDYACISEAKAAIIAGAEHNFSFRNLFSNVYVIAGPYLLGYQNFEEEERIREENRRFYELFKERDLSCMEIHKQIERLELYFKEQDAKGVTQNRGEDRRRLQEHLRESQTGDREGREGGRDRGCRGRGKESRGRKGTSKR